ncbi:hypothetical protein SteCoe_29427 [Stentor coeruleus]|uniref:Uncharacterized protein n=1 Tax=Stentor coeruleus TaxID=5963 RepID=A0A1R2B5X6_9CILI|nr:hypothetical protein SteCoe_29427 [Stentor coeruleus]
MGEDFDFDLFVKFIVWIIESEPLGLLKSLLSNLLYFGEAIESNTQQLFIAIRANKLFHIVIFYSLVLWLLYTFLFPKRKSISITYVNKVLNKESQDALMKKFQSKNQEIKAMLEKLKGTNDTKKPNEILKKIDQAINEIKNLQDLHNEFKGEIIDSHNQIIESLKPNRSNYYREVVEPTKKLENGQKDWENVEKFEVKEDQKVYDDGEKELISVGKNEDIAGQWVKDKDFDVKSKENDIENSFKAEKIEKAPKLPPKQEPVAEKNDKIPLKPLPKTGNPFPKFPVPKLPNLAPKPVNPKAKAENTDQKTLEKVENPPKPIEKAENPIRKPIEKIDNPFQKTFEKTDNPLPKPGENPDTSSQKNKEKIDTPFQKVKPDLAKTEISQEKTENTSMPDQPIEKSYLKQEKPEPKTKELEKSPINEEIKNQAEDSEEKHTESTPKPNVPPRPKIFQPRPAPLSIGKAPPIRGKAVQPVPSERAQYVAPSIKSSPFG